MLAEYKSSTTLGYKKKPHCNNIKSGLTSRRALRMSLLSTSEEKRGTEEETGRRNGCQKELKGSGLGEVIGIRKQSAFWLWSKGIGWQPSQRAQQHKHLPHTARGCLGALEIVLAIRKKGCGAAIGKVLYLWRNLCFLHNSQPGCLFHLNIPFLRSFFLFSFYFFGKLFFMLPSTFSFCWLASVGSWAYTTFTHG